MLFTDPLAQSDKPPTYRPEEAAEHVTSEGHTAYVVPSRAEWGREFCAALDEGEDHPFLVGSWHDRTWLVMGVRDKEKAEDVAESMGLDVTDMGPIAYFDEDTQELFPLQPHEDIYAVTKTRRSDS